MFGGQIDASPDRRHPQARRQRQHDRPDRHDHARGRPGLLRRPPGRILVRRDGRVPDPARAVVARAAGRPDLGRTCRKGSCSTPTPGLSINNFTAGVKFFSIAAVDHRPDAAQRPGVQRARRCRRPADWLTMIESQVVAQYKAILKNPERGRVPGGLHLADDDHRQRHDLLDLHEPAALQRPGDRRVQHRRQVPGRRQAQLRR